MLVLQSAHLGAKLHRLLRDGLELVVPPAVHVEVVLRHGSKTHTLNTEEEKKRSHTFEKCCFSHLMVLPQRLSVRHREQSDAHLQEATEKKHDERRCLTEYCGEPSRA